MRLTHAVQPQAEGAYHHDPAPRRLLGMAKAVAARQAKAARIVPANQRLWGKRTLCLPVASRDHQLAVFGYICSHERQGSDLWRGKR